MAFISADTWRKNGVGVIIVDVIKWLNETNIEEQFGRPRLTMHNIQNT